MGISRLNFRAMTFLLVVSAGTVSFQNCSQAKMGIAGQASSEEGALGGPITPDDPNVPPDDPNAPPGTIPPDDGGDPGDPEIGCGSNIVQNGDFEVVDSRVGLVNLYRLDQLVAGKLFDVYSSIPAWTADAGTSGIEVQASSTAPAGSGSHFVELDSLANSKRGDSTNSGMSQSVNIPAQGQFILSYLYRGRTNSPGDNGISILVDESPVGRRADGQMATWQKIRVRLDLAAGFKKLSFRATGLETSLGGLVDRISLRWACD